MLKAPSTIIGVDIQNDFITGVYANPEAKKCLPRITDSIARLMFGGANLILTKDTHFYNYMETEEAKQFPAEHCIRGTWGWELADCIKPLLKLNNVTVIEKNAFRPDKMDKWYIVGGVYILGFCTDICVKAIALELRDIYPERPITVLYGCCAGTSAQAHDDAIQEIKAAGILMQEVYDDPAIDIVMDTGKSCPFCGHELKGAREQ